tara:strand:+ start:3055 stop:4179 length:1125 start_codon:yes stop_codon:yes gene_type:complete
MKRCLKLTFIFNLIIKLAFAQSIDELNSFKKNIFSFEDSSNIVKYIPKSKFNICFSGEYHVSWQNSFFEEKLIERLYLSNNLRDVILEFSLSFKPYINAYVLRNKKDSLNLLDKEYKLTKRFINFLDWVKDFNIGKSKTEKITLHPIDAEPNPKLTFNYIKEVIKTINDSIKLKSQISNLIESSDSKNGLQVTKNLIKTINLNYNFLISIIEKNSLEKINTLLRGVVLSFEYQIEKKLFRVVDENTLFLDSIASEKREEFMFENFISLYDSSKFYFGQFGKAHCDLNENVKDDYNSNFKPLTSRLNTSDYFKNKVCVLDICYAFPSCLNQENHRNLKKVYKELNRGVYGLPLNIDEEIDLSNYPKLVNYIIFLK